MLGSAKSQFFKFLIHQASILLFLAQASRRILQYFKNQFCECWFFKQSEPVQMEYWEQSKLTQPIFYWVGLLLHDSFFNEYTRIHTLIDMYAYADRKTHFCKLLK